MTAKGNIAKNALAYNVVRADAHHVTVRIPDPDARRDEAEADAKLAQRLLSSLDHPERIKDLLDKAKERVREKKKNTARRRNDHCIAFWLSDGDYQHLRVIARLANGDGTDNVSKRVMTLLSIHGATTWKELVAVAEKHGVDESTFVKGVVLKDIETFSTSAISTLAKNAPSIKR